MKFAVFSLLEQREDDTPANVFSKVLEQSEAAEDLGYDAMWLAEHHFTDYGILPSPAVLGAAIAQRTTRLRIGTACSILPFHDPRRLAEDYALLDVLSNGRLDFGVGRGYQPAEFASFGVSMDEARGRFNEALDIIRGLWTTEGFTYEGQYHSVHDLTLYPRPVHDPHPPIWMAAVSPESFELAAKAGLQILTAPQITPLPRVKGGYDAYRAAWREAGGDPEGLTLPMQRPVYAGATEQAACEEPAENMMWYQRANAARMTSKDGTASKEYAFYQKAQANVEKAEYEDMFKVGHLLFGDPESLVEKISTLRDEVGLNYLICWMNVGGLDQKLVLQSMERFAREVMPRFAEETT